MDTRDRLDQLSNPKTSEQTEIEIISNEVGKSVDLPIGETPTLATVNDVTKLKDQTFFKYAQNGDKLLFYPKANRALLYRYSSKKIVEYSTVTLGNQESQTQTQPQTAQPPAAKTTQ